MIPIKQPLASLVVGKYFEPAFARLIRDAVNVKKIYWAVTMNDRLYHVELTNGS